MSRLLLLLTVAGTLASCISFPYYETQKRKDALYGESPGVKQQRGLNNPFSRKKAKAKKRDGSESEAGPVYDYNSPVRKREGFQDHYFR